MKQTNPHYRYYDLIMSAFVCILLCSNLIGASKIVQIGPLTFGAGILFFPISYIFGDILTEVYGYKRARKVVWAGFIALIFASFMSWFVLALPPANGWGAQSAFETVFASTPRLVLGSLIAFFCGEFCNSFVLAKMKIYTHGKMLWSRIVGSTVVGEAVDSIIFYPIAFYRIWPDNLLWKVMITNYSLKVLWEIIIIPVTYRVVIFLKAVEHEDYYDYHTNFTPFSLKD